MSENGTFKVDYKMKFLSIMILLEWGYSNVIVQLMTSAKTGIQ
jgi:hypothetical protein